MSAAMMMASGVAAMCSRAGIGGTRDGWSRFDISDANEGAPSASPLGGPMWAGGLYLWLSATVLVEPGTPLVENVYR